MHVYSGVFLSLEEIHFLHTMSQYSSMILELHHQTSSPAQLTGSHAVRISSSMKAGTIYPNRSWVAHISEQPTPTAFHSDRDSRGDINLYCTSTDVKFPVGRFCHGCETMDATNTIHTLCVTICEFGWWVYHQYIGPLPACFTMLLKIGHWSYNYYFPSVAPAITANITTEGIATVGHLCVIFYLDWKGSMQ